MSIALSAGRPRGLLGDFGDLGTVFGLDTVDPGLLGACVTKMKVQKLSAHDLYKNSDGHVSRTNMYMYRPQSNRTELNTNTNLFIINKLFLIINHHFTRQTIGMFAPSKISRC